MTDWIKHVYDAAGSADRFETRDVVPILIALQLAARLEECQKLQVKMIKNIANSQTTQATV